MIPTLGLVALICALIVSGALLLLFIGIWMNLVRLVEMLPALTASTSCLNAACRSVVGSADRLNESSGSLAGVLRDVRALAASSEDAIAVAKRLESIGKDMVVSAQALKASQDEAIAQYRVSVETTAQYLAGFETPQRREQREHNRDVMGRPPRSVHVTTAEDGTGSASGDGFTHTEA